MRLLVQFHICLQTEMSSKSNKIYLICQQIENEDIIIDGGYINNIFL